MPFAKGTSGNPGGRPQGRQNNATQEIRALARSLFDKPYWERVRAQVAEGTLHPAIEARLLAYAFGQPSQEPSGKGVVVNLGFITPAQSSIAIEDQNTIEATAQGMTLQTRR